VEKTTRLEINWYNDYDEDPMEPIDIWVRQDPEITKEGIFLSYRGWQELCAQVNSLIKEMEKRVRRISL